MNYMINMFRGRLNRRTYLIGILILLLVLLFVGRLSSYAYDSLQSDSVLIVFGIFLMIWCFYWFSLVTRRAHDLNHRGIWGVILPSHGLRLIIDKGDQGNNKYGYKPNNVIDVKKLIIPA
jgi:uncharacterized membrane protein YhaH (DUF805 family)